MFDSELDAWVTIQHPTDMGVSFEILTKSKKSSAHKARLSVLGRKYKKDERLAAKTRKEVDPLKYQDELFQMAVALVSDWRGVMDGDKQKPYDEAQLLKLVQTQDWIYDQLDDFQADDDNFFTVPAAKN